MLYEIEKKSGNKVRIPEVVYGIKHKAGKNISVALIEISSVKDINDLVGIEKGGLNLTRNHYPQNGWKYFTMSGKEVKPGPFFITIVNEY